jgi:hypothetical protein
LEKSRMIRRTDLVRRFEDEQMASSRGTFQENLAVFEALWEHARRLGVLPSRDPLEGIEVDVQLARVLRVRKSPPGDRSRSPAS